jgi:hypothetical protein
VKAFIALLLASACSANGDVRPLAAVAGDLAPSHLVAPRDSGPVPGNLAAVTHARELSFDRELSLRPSARPDRSRRWWAKVKGSDLVGGIALPTTAGGATVSLRPLDEARAATGIDPNALVLVDPDGIAHDGDAAMEHVLGWDELRAGESPFAPGTSAFRIDGELGHGEWQLRVDAPLGDSDVLVHVVEPDSALELTARTDAPAYLHGHTVVIDVDARRGEAFVEIAEASARARSPSGETQEIHLVASTKGSMQGTLELAEVVVASGAAWVVEVDARIEHDGMLARRNARVAFAYGVPSAALDGRFELVDTARGDPTLALGLEVATAGRYAVAAVVWGTDAHGRAWPVGAVEAATWLEPDADGIELPLARLLDTPGLSAPYELRDLRLVDQSRLAILHRQAIAVAFTPP